MASKRKVTQDDLRKMMAEMKSSSTSSTKTSANKKLKLSARELALLEEEKRSKAQKDLDKLRLKQEKMSRIVPNKDLQPKKSILKNTSSTTSNFVPPEYYQQMKNLISKKKDTDIESCNSAKKSAEDPIPQESVTKPSVESDDEEEEESGKIPEGFFDDPKLDAKARQVQYVNVEEEEWQKFQKEIAEEEVNAQEILTEDRNEATTDRQIEEIDEQIEAWKRYIYTGCSIWIVTRGNECCDYVFGVRLFSLQIYAGNMCMHFDFWNNIFFKFFKVSPL